MSAWWENHHASLPELDSDTRRSIEYITGGIPLLLWPLLQFKSGEEYDPAKFLASKELVSVQRNIKSFYQKMFHRKLTTEQRDQ